ncbi:MAG: hydroxyphenylacetyl-CoA thioesterase PaaI [Rhodobacter sp.]|uniref:hydroxyphenylacetyl-CoA thioesterase PaaI n=1 Tax=Pararhodobacter sp. TaxID=2127056 RepID=UPI001D899A92|nr:hydroxyphenylacetyl-CoA thioesterase PaaI [Pararhodobacter sp.]MCB1343928.1 hydroxyphenylacetyl-CoA thioesterase PaaI [Paracoccaceae bacterium]MCC0072905.1 hydroxyphenylacetyl-CoA thioesterase PaaI [Rhodobacter sp.]HPD92940.1 hydroxyphenylacetyl-CoA thioesterase PaaI [Pararhodobacter sp.]
MTPDHLARASAQAMLADDNASRHLGMSLDFVAPGQATLTMTVRPEMTNGHKTCHGGYIFTLADSAFAFACNTYNQRTVAQMAAVSFLAPAFEGDLLTATAQEVWRQGRGGIYDVRVTNQSGTPIAEFRGHSRTVKGTHLPEPTE